MACFEIRTTVGRRGTNCVAVIVIRIDGCLGKQVASPRVVDRDGISGFCHSGKADVARLDEENSHRRITLPEHMVALGATQA